MYKVNEKMEIQKNMSNKGKKVKKEKNNFVFWQKKNIFLY